MAMLMDNRLMRPIRRSTGGFPPPPAGYRYLYVNGVPLKVNGEYVLVKI